MFCWCVCLTGVGLGCNHVPIHVIIQQHFSQNRALAAGLASTGASFGLLVGGPVIRLLMDHYGWRGSILLMAAISAQCLLAAVLLYPPDRGTRGQSQEQAVTGDMDGHEEHIQPHQDREHDECSAQEKMSAVSSVIEKPLTTRPSEMKQCQENLPKKGYMRCMKTKLGTMCACFDLSLLGDLAFLLLFLAAMPTTFGAFTCRNYNIQRAIEQGIQRPQAAFLSTAWGVGSLCGRLVGGLIGNMGCTIRPLYYSLTIFTGGLLMMLSTTTQLMPTIVLHAVFSVAMGTLVGECLLN